ncbi:sterol desaturase family protein [Pontibacter sp. MBLB2868]|uniref:sterol desaturase family protein n=1 Tax=Pontibacter sp. MBLB2868 TaxID=3451555 RepID=UPI003F75439D
MRFLFPKFDKVGMPLLGVAAAALFVLEAKRQLRPRTRPLAERLVENGSVAAAALPALRFLLVPVTYATASMVTKKGCGILPLLMLPRWAAYGLGFLMLDYSNYLWHVLLHKSEWLWRFHNVHHTDLDLDLSTAWRFHVGENIASVPYRSAVVVAAGIPASLVLLYEVIFEGCTAFHHSNLRLPLQVERGLSKVMVTPRLHGIHHSIVAKETNSNFSVILSWWDRLHNTLRLNVPQAAITIGTPAYRDPAEQTPKCLFLMPFQKQRPWVLPDGTVPERPEIPNREQLLS